MGGWKLKPKIASTINSQFSFPFSSTKLSKESLMGMLNVLHCLTNACKNDINQLEEFFKRSSNLVQRFRRLLWVKNIRFVTKMFQVSRSDQSIPAIVWHKVNKNKKLDKKSYFLAQLALILSLIQ